MGAIQGSINNMLGTVAAGVALGKHAAEQKEAAIEKAIDTRADLKEETPKLAEEFGDVQKQKQEAARTGKAVEELEREGAAKTFEDKATLLNWKTEGLNDMIMAGEAERALEAKVAAHNYRTNKVNKVLKRAGILDEEMDTLNLEAIRNG